VAARAGATLTHGRLAAVDPARDLVMLAGGRLLSYDALIVAIGARAEPSVRGALGFTGHADVASVRAMVDEIAQAAARSAAIPLAVVTSEDTPLVFGPDAGAAVDRVLAREGVSVHAGTVVREWRWGQLELLGGGTLDADRVIALPVERGPFLDGVPSDSQGFARIGADGAVPGAPDVWAVGDGSSCPVKQGGIACQQADSVASAIVRRLGMEVEEVPFEPRLRGWIWDGGPGTFLRTDLAGGRTESPGVAGDGPLWWPAAKLAGRYLAPFLQGWPADAALADRVRPRWAPRRGPEAGPRRDDPPAGDGRRGRIPDRAGAPDVMEHPPRQATTITWGADELPRRRAHRRPRAGERLAAQREAAGS
jgi:sulfide:quinone oxidoreductase